MYVNMDFRFLENNDFKLYYSSILGTHKKAKICI